MTICDPFFVACCKHFSNLFKRYHAPVTVIDLVKQREKTPRESVLYEEYGRAIAYMNKFLDDDFQIEHVAWDMARAAKSEDQDVIGYLEGIAKRTLARTGICVYNCPKGQM